MLCVATNSHAAGQQNDPSTHLSYGGGGASYGLWMKTKQDGAEAYRTLEQWTAGFLSGVEFAHSMLVIGTAITSVGTNAEATAAQESAPFFLDPVLADALRCARRGPLVSR